MNIFLLDRDPIKCAKYMVNSHVVKMVTEHAQMMSTVVRQSGVDCMGYKTTHPKHPCTLWAGESLSNWLYLRDLTKAINNEWKYRYDHEINHKSYDVILALPLPDIPDIGLTDFALAMPDEYRQDDAIASYRAYYIGDKSHLFKWKRRRKPKWITQNL
jgi:hypothetical protein